MAMIVAVITLAGCSGMERPGPRNGICGGPECGTNCRFFAVSKLDISEVYGKKAHVVVTGFADEFNRGYV